MTESRLTNSVALIITDAAGCYLVVKRPADPSDDIAGVWGFPAATSKQGEHEVDTAIRVGIAKLGVEVELGRRVGESTHERRDSHFVHLVDYEARIIRGTPEVPQKDPAITQYVDLKYTDDPLVVLEAARKGSQCTQLFLEDLGIAWKEVDAAESTNVRF